MINWTDYTEGGIGAIVGAALTIFGFKSRINNIEKNHQDLKKETKTMFREIRADIKLLIAKAANRRVDDFD